VEESKPEAEQAADSRPPRARPEFVIEGDLKIAMNNGCPMFLVNDAHLSEMVAFHFGARRDEYGKRSFGRVQIIISEVYE
jgi:hypothetical protein